MKYLSMTALSGLFFLTLTACNGTEDEAPDTNEPPPENGIIDADPDEGTDNENGDEDSPEPADPPPDDESGEADEGGNDEPSEQTETVPSTFVIQGEHILLNDEDPFIFTIQLERLESEQPDEERFLQSLVNSDQTSNNVLSELQELTIENETEASLYFSEDEMVDSMASTEHLNFTEMLNEISALFGIEQLHFYIEDEPGLRIGQSEIIETMEVEATENRGYYLFPADDSDEDFVYVSGATVGEEITNEEGELFDFNETVTAMQQVTDENVDRQPGIPETVEIHDASLDGKQAEVTYSITEGQESEWIDEVKTHFENVLQLAALQFQAEELHLTNETEQTTTIFQLTSE